MKTKYVVLTSISMYLIFFGPISVFAQAGASQTAIGALLQQIKALQAQILQLQAQQINLEKERRETVIKLVSALREGAQGDDVKTLQAILAMDQNIYPEGVISGYFGRLTTNAVKRFQKKHDIEQAGNVGPKTLKKLNELLEKNPLSIEMATSSERTATSTGNREGRKPKKEGRICAIIPPGHLIAPGWLRKHDAERPIVPECQKLPHGIEQNLNRDREDKDKDENENNDNDHATTTPPVVDTIAPTISNITVSQVASTTANVLWTTNELAIGKLYFSTSTPLDINLAQIVSKSTFSLNHGIVLSSLSESTTYYYIIEVKDAANNIATTSQYSLVTTQ